MSIGFRKIFNFFFVNFLTVAKEFGILFFIYYKKCLFLYIFLTYGKILKSGSKSGCIIKAQRK